MSCVVCGEEGRDFTGTPRAERLVFLSRALWDLHKLRQVLEPDSTVLSEEVSGLIRSLESMGDVLLDLDPNG